MLQSEPTALLMLHYDLCFMFYDNLFISVRSKCSPKDLPTLYGRKAVGASLGPGCGTSSGKKLGSTSVSHIPSVR